MVSPEAVINIFCGGFFAILAYALLIIIMFGRKKKFTGVIEKAPGKWPEPPRDTIAGYVTSDCYTPEPKPIHAPGKWEQPSKPWPIVIENIPEYYVKEINNKIVIVMGEENA
jgi:hypothetical protein